MKLYYFASITSKAFMSAQTSHREERMNRNNNKNGHSPLSPPFSYNQSFSSLVEVAKLVRSLFGKEPDTIEFATDVIQM